MRLSLLAATCLSPAVLLLAQAARADTNVSGSGNVGTSTVAGGTADNAVVPSGSTLSPASGTAITIDSANTVGNAGTISFTGIDNATAIGGGGGFAGGIANSGAITVGESFTATDTTGDGLVDAPFAAGTGRYGIHLTGSGPFGGTVASSGTITVQGNNSAGIAADVAITGNVTSSGTVKLTGDNGAAVRLGPVGGFVAITGTTTATGQNSTAVSLAGPVGGAVVIHGTLSATGYTATTLPASTATINAQDLLQGGSALMVGGSVGGGVLVAAAPASTTDTTIDADGDGIADASEGTAVVSSYGSAPTVQIGAVGSAVTLGTVGSTGAGFVNNGTISTSGVYPGIAAAAVQIGGSGAPVSITGGITNTGSLTASANGADATAIRLGSGAATPVLTNSGTISASSTTTVGASATAIRIDAGASLPGIVNSGTISALSAANGGTATAIADASGTLAAVSNTGTITASGASSASTAIDARANGGGFTYTQSLASSTASAPAITGTILTGSGGDQIIASAGTIKSDISTGSGNDTIALSGTAALTGSATFGNGNDRLSLADTSSFTGTATFGGGANQLAIGGGATFSGTIIGGSTLALSLAGGTLALTGTGASQVAGLAVSGGTIGVTINPATGAHSELDVAGAATFTGSATVSATLSGLPTGTASYTVIRAGALSGTGNLKFTIGALPYLLTGSLNANETTGIVSVDLNRKTAAKLGFTRSETAAYDAVYTDIVGNTQLSTLFLGLGDQASLLQRYRQMLPDHAGGVFDVLDTGVRMLAPMQNVTPWGQLGSVSLWAQQGYWSPDQHAVETPGYSATGWGLSAGADLATGPLGRAGVSVNYVFGHVKDASRSTVSVNQAGGGLYWLADFGGLHLAAYGAAGLVRAEDDRSLSGTTGATAILLTSTGKWHGLLLSGIGRASYEAHLGRFYLRPAGTVSYVRLHENAHDDSGGGAAFDLLVDARNSTEEAAEGTLALGYQIGVAGDEDATSIRIEGEGGRRQIFGGTVGATTAHFAGGSDFTLLPEDRDSGYTGTLRLTVGSSAIRVVASATAEKRDGYNEVLGQIGLRGSF